MEHINGFKAAAAAIIGALTREQAAVVPDRLGMIKEGA